MKQSTRIAKDMFDKCGALVSITDIAKYFGISANTARRIVAGVPPISQGTGETVLLRGSRRGCGAILSRRANQTTTILS